MDSNFLSNPGVGTSLGGVPGGGGAWSVAMVMSLSGVAEMVDARGGRDGLECLLR